MIHKYVLDSFFKIEIITESCYTKIKLKRSVHCELSLWILEVEVNSNIMRILMGYILV